MLLKKNEGQYYYIDSMYQLDEPQIMNAIPLPSKILFFSLPLRPQSPPLGQKN